MGVRRLLEPITHGVWLNSGVLIEMESRELGRGSAFA